MPNILADVNIPEWPAQVKSMCGKPMMCLCVRERKCVPSLGVLGVRGPLICWLCCCLCVCSWLSALESTKWLQHLSLLLKAALLVVHAVDRDHRPVLVHCSDGWDRTPQIVALSKLLLDPYYRTIEVQMKTLIF